MKYLRPYQVEAVEVLAEGGLNASGLGAGKTLIGVMTCSRMKLGRAPRILVVAPINTLRQWEQTFLEQFPSLGDKGLIHIVGTHRKDAENWALMTKKKPGVYLIGWSAAYGAVPEWIRRKTSKGKNANAAKPKVTMEAVKASIKEGFVPPWTRTGVWDLLILDEIHRASNKNGVPHHVAKLIKATRKQGLSHTPGGNRPEGLWSVLNILWPDIYGSFWKWAYEHFEVIEEKTSKSPWSTETHTKIGRELRPGGVWGDIPAVVRYRTEDVCQQLPPVIEREVLVSMAPEQKEQYEEFEAQSLAWLSDLPIAAPLPVEQRTRLRQAALGQLRADEVEKRKTVLISPDELKRVLSVPGNKLLGPDGDPDSDLLRVSVLVDAIDISYEKEAEQVKLEAVREILADLPEGEPLLVWTHSAKWARMAEEALGKQSVAWTNRTTAAKRRRIESGFGTEWRVLIAQVQSLAEGVDWLNDVCRCEVIASCTEDEVMNEQAEGRLHRPGQKSPVQRWRLVTEGTIDDEVYLNNLAKRARMGSLYRDNQRAVEAA